MVAMEAKILIGASNEEFAAFIHGVIESVRPGCPVLLASDYPTLSTALLQDPSITGVVTDLVWEEQNLYEQILGLSLGHPGVAWTVVSPYDLTGSLPVSSPFPTAFAPNSHEPVQALMPFLFEDLRGHQLGDYTIEEFAGQNRLGRSYRARHTKINRTVFLTVTPEGADQNQRDAFRMVATAMARVSHPAVEAIYESGEAAGHLFLAHEFTNAPTLLELRASGQTLDSRMIARVLRTAGTAITYMQGISIPHFTIGLEHITLAPDGVVKVRNCATPHPDAMPDTAAQIAHLATQVRVFAAPHPPLHLPLSQLIQNAESGRIDLASFTAEAERIEVELAPVKVVPKRKEQVMAEAALLKARKQRYLILGLGTAATVVGIIVFFLLMVNKFAPMPGTDFRTQMEIPAGPVQIGKDIPPLQVNRFYMDQHEVTIGQYEKFLLAIEGRSIEQILPDAAISPLYFPKLDVKTFLLSARQVKKDAKGFQPEDWAGILRAASRRTAYQHERLTKDSPIFGVDFIDALAYAHWAGKRLPTELEWQRAAAGDKFLAYPWGNTESKENANTGVDFNPTREFGAGEKDGFRGPGPVDRFPRDVSPFGVFCMAGNVSEWTIVSPELPPPGRNAYSANVMDNIQIIRGGNYSEPRLFPTFGRFPNKATKRQAMVGFRLASDQPVP